MAESVMLPDHLRMALRDAGYWNDFLDELEVKAEAEEPVFRGHHTQQFSDALLDAGRGEYAAEFESWLRDNGLIIGRSRDSSKAEYFIPSNVYDAMEEAGLKSDADKIVNGKYTESEIKKVADELADAGYDSEARELRGWHDEVMETSKMSRRQRSSKFSRGRRSPSRKDSRPQRKAMPRGRLTKAGIYDAEALWYEWRNGMDSWDFAIKLLDMPISDAPPEEQEILQSMKDAVGRHFNNLHDTIQSFSEDFQDVYDREREERYGKTRRSPNKSDEPRISKMVKQAMRDAHLRTDIVAIEKNKYTYEDSVAVVEDLHNAGYEREAGELKKYVEGSFNKAKSETSKESGYGEDVSFVDGEGEDIYTVRFRDTDIGVIQELGAGMEGYLFVPYVDFGDDQMEPEDGDTIDELKEQVIDQVEEMWYILDERYSDA